MEPPKDTEGATEPSSRADHHARLGLEMGLGRNPQ